MAIKIPGLKLFTTADAKTRVFLVIAALAAIGLFTYGIISYFGGGTTTTSTRVASAPSGLQTVPGGKMTPEFYRAVVQANQQAAQQAQISGGSALPSMINVPGQGFGQQNCTILCPSLDQPNVADDINALIKEGKLSQEDGNALMELAKNNVPIEEYAAALDELVRQGKLTPEQARALLEKYKKQHANNLANASAQVMDGMIKAGKLSLDTANELLALQKKGLTPAEYEAELNRLVREGKLSPEAAAQLLAQYTQQKMAEEARKGNFRLRQMAKAGEITGEVANALAALQARNVPVDEYEAELNRLVAAGKMTPEAAAKLLAQYKKQRAIDAAGGINALVKQEEGKSQALLNELVKAGRIPPDAANALLALQQKNVTPQEYQNALGQLVQARKITPQDAQRLLANYQRLAAVRAQAARLAKLQGNNVSLNDYADELKRAVQLGLMTPDQAAALLGQYRSLQTAQLPTPGTTPAIETNIPGGVQLGQLQERLQAQQGAAPPPAEEAVQFQPPPPVQAAPPPPDTSAQERLQRIQQIQAAMAAQAQNLISAWQPVAMVHKDGAPPEKPKEGPPGGPPTNIPPAPLGATALGTTEKLVKKPPLIKMGTILFAVLDTAVNSDYPDTPVMATIVQGPLKGARLMGKLQLVEGMDRVSLNFTMMDRDDWLETKSVNAFAIDPDTARTVMASCVDHHYLTKYGAIMATSFISGYASAITQAGTSTTGIFGTSTTHPTLSPGNKLAVALGQIGTNLNSIVAKWVDTPTTVTVNPGVGLGILFMADVPA